MAPGGKYDGTARKSAMIPSTRSPSPERMAASRATTGSGPSAACVDQTASMALPTRSQAMKMPGSPGIMLIRPAVASTSSQ